MPRPTKCRRVELEPKFTYFKPAGIPKHLLTELELSVEELEAIRLKDLVGLEQEECATRMYVSRPTFQRILSAARGKLAEAVVEGKAIKITGGHYRVERRTAGCVACDHSFEILEGRDCRQEVSCPHCGVHMEKKEKGPGSC
jgi:predicted DNA-binding protein (UPF0251 family)